MTHTTALLADPVSREHLAGRPHPECPARFDAVLEGLRGAGLLDRLVPIQPRAATLDELLLCHTSGYLDTARRDIASGAHYLSTGDTEISPASWEAAVRAAGGVLNAVDAVVEGRARNAFCVVRPPGHHAGAARGMGFCVFNNVALAARYAQRKHGLDRVLIVDWDVHHGNGTQDLFYSDPTVFYFSTHQWPLYPGTGRADETGAGSGVGATMNFPFPPGAGRREILGAVRDGLLPAAREYRPNLVLVSAGFDSRAGDPLGRFTLTDEDFAALTEAVMEIAAHSAGGRLVSVLEGGYNLAGLATAASAHVAALSL
jgi:acetoin utilization deacetylase AcuC-like enzyme